MMIVLEQAGAVEVGKDADLNVLDKSPLAVLSEILKA